MTGEDLKQVIRHWQLNAAQCAKVLCIHSNKMSEYLDDITKIPCAMAFHIDALNHIDPEQRQKIFQQRLAREPHQRLAIKIKQD